MGDTAIDSSYQALRTNTVMGKKTTKKQGYGDKSSKIDYTAAFGGKKRGK